MAGVEAISGAVGGCISLALTYPLLQVSIWVTVLRAVLMLP